MKNSKIDLFEPLLQRISQVKEVDSLKRNAMIIAEIRSTIKKLVDLYEGTSFDDEQLEIEYYKSIRPKFYAMLIFYSELYNLEKAVQFLDSIGIKSYYADELKFIDVFFNRNQFCYQYYRLNATELDQLYFLMGSNIQSHLIPAVPELVPESGTSTSYLFSKFIAYENLRIELQTRADILVPQDKPEAPANQDDPITWTGDSINLVELAFGIYLTGQLNNGNISLSRVVRWLEQQLNIRIGLPHRRFDEIIRRKRISATKFIDLMKEALLKKMSGG